MGVVAARVGITSPPLGIVYSIPLRKCSTLSSGETYPSRLRVIKPIIEIRLPGPKKRSSHFCFLFACNLIIRQSIQYMSKHFICSVFIALPPIPCFYSRVRNIENG